MIKTTAMLVEELSRYASPKSKLSRMAERGLVVPIVKGLYETDKSTPPYLLAASIYGPSYISFEFALSYYGLIPEAVYAVTCATVDKKKTKRYVTPFGTFIYRDVPSRAFPLALKIVKEGGYYFRIALPEKALCDKLYAQAPAANLSELEYLLTDDMRMGPSGLRSLDSSLIEMLAQNYRSTNVNKLRSFLRRLKGK